MEHLQPMPDLLSALLTAGVVSPILDVDVLGDPIAEPRPRSSVRRTKGGRTYAAVRASSRPTPWKKAVRETVRDELDRIGEVWAARPVIPDGPVGVSLAFRMPRPLEHYVARDPSRPIRERFLSARPTGRPDVDNLAKAVLDAVGSWPKGAVPLLWNDDDQVVELLAEKFFADRDDPPGVRLLVWRS